MIVRLTPRFSRRSVILSVALSIGFSVFCAAQPTAPAPVNPRAPADDPRIGLKAGLYDAGEASFGLLKVASLPKPPGFDAVVNTPARPAEGARPAQPPRIQYGSTNSDLAFSGNHLFVGNYNGINFYDIDNPASTKLRTSLVCPGGQGDVSVYGHLLFMSDEAENGRIDCGTQGIPLPAGYTPPPPPGPPVPGQPRAPRPPAPASAERFRGVRIFDISDIANPKQVAAVQTCRGSHTHTLVIDPTDKDDVFIYVSGTAVVRSGQELSGCTNGEPENNPNTSRFSIDIIKVPLAHPEQAKIIASPRIFADSKTGAIDGLWKGGSHGEGTQTTSETDKCHDITVYSAIGLAAGACSGNGILLDISHPEHPVRIDAVGDPNYAFWHSANFANDGSKVLFTDEWGGGGQPRCRATDPMNWGADAIYTISGHKLTLASYYKMPAPQTELENCVAHNGSLVPIPGRDILVQAWYQGGVSMMDFTDPKHAYEIGYFDRGPVDATRRSMGGMWSVYWYNGFIYGSEIARGVDVFKMVPNKFITQNEIDAANQVHFTELNVQDQPKIVWPSNFTVARAYIDQLARGNSISSQRLDAIKDAISKAEQSRSRKDLSHLKSLASNLDKEAGSAKTPADQHRMRALADIMKQGGGITAQ